jgi:NTP pyrophosphatase (non-canonical NTP hydrolase)
MTLKEIMDIQKDFDQRHAGRTKFYVEITDKNIEVLELLLVCLVGELGEIANITKKIHRGDKAISNIGERRTRGRRKITLSDPHVRAHLAEEIADVFIYLVKMCNQLGVDLEAEFLKKLAFNKRRFRPFKR